MALMLKTRRHLQMELEKLTNNVYFQPPATIKMKYPCIVYERDRVDTREADNKHYSLFPRYAVTVITRNPDDPLPEEILETFPGSSFDRTFVSENLYHHTFTIYL